MLEMAPTLTQKEIHDVAHMFPMMSTDEYKQLVEDIKSNGLQTPIWTHQGKIIDGRNRYKACIEAGVEPRYQEWDGAGSLVNFVVSLNLNRRHLTSSQKAMVALDVEKQLAEEAKQRQIEAGKAYGEGHAKSQEVVEIFPQALNKAANQAARLTGTNHHYVTDAKKIVEKAPELREAVMDGTLNIPEAKAVAKLPEPQRATVVQQVTSGKAKNAKSAILDLKKAEVEAQAQAAPTKPTITNSSCVGWLYKQEQEEADLLLTDPPYETEVKNIYVFATSWLPYALSTVKDTGRAYVCIGAYPDELQSYLSCPVPPHMRLRQVLVWEYKNTMGPQPTHTYKQNWQAILYFTGVNAAPLDCPLMNEQFSVLEFNAPDGRIGDRYHTWQKPMDLAERLIRHSTKPGDRVIDCFAGTGTFLLAAHKLGRLASGCDISDEMIEIARQRGCEVI